MLPSLITLFRRYRCLAGLALLVVGTGCQPTPPPPVTTPVTTAPAAAVAKPVIADTPPVRLAPLGDYRLLEVALGNAIDSERRVTRTQSRFQSTDTLYLSVLGSAASTDLALSVRWLDAAGHVIAQAEQPLPAGSASVTTFSAQHPQTWPAGQYRVELAVNGQPLDFREFNVQ